ncbi:hypothetical protein ACM2AM_000723, partial [Campylobacter jejuni]
IFRQNYFFHNLKHPNKTNKSKIELLPIINNKKQTELQNYKIFKNILNFIIQIMRNFVTFI